MERIKKIKLPTSIYKKAWNIDTILKWLQLQPNNGLLDLKTLRAKYIILFKMVDLSKSSDIHRILYFSLTFNSEDMEDTRMPMKNSRLRDLRNFKYTRNIQNSKICVVDT
jgi:hypothetical protein